MGLQAVPAFIGHAGEPGYQHPVSLFRNLLEGIFSRTGALRYGDFAIAPMVGSYGITIGAGTAFVLGTETGQPQQGGYFVWSDASENVLWPSAGGSNRWDSLICRVVDKQFGTDPGVSRAEWEVVPGTTGAPPPDSDFVNPGSQWKPGAWWRVADYLTQPGDGGVINPSNIVRHHKYVRVGGYTPCLSTALPSDPVAGDRVWFIDTGLWKWYNGTTWELTPSITYDNTLAVDTASLTIPVPLGIKQLELRWFARSTTVGNGQALQMRLNGISTGSYYHNHVQGSNAAVNHQGTFASTSAEIGVFIADSQGAGVFSDGVIELNGVDAPQASPKITGLVRSGVPSGALVSSWVRNTAFLALGVTSPVTSITLFPAANNFKAGSRFVVRALA